MDIGLLIKKILAYSNAIATTFSCGGGMAFVVSQQQMGLAPHGVHRGEKRKDRFITSKNSGEERVGEVIVTCG